MPAKAPTLQSSYRTMVMVTWNGGTFVEECVTFTGGAFDSDETKLATAAMQPERAAGGRPTTSNVTVGIVYDEDVHAPFITFLRNARGKGDMTVTRQKLDVNGARKGDPLQYTGKLKALSPVDIDVNGNNPDIFTLEQSSDGT